jgi:hypothetical protein
MEKAKSAQDNVTNNEKTLKESRKKNKGTENN